MATILPFGKKAYDFAMRNPRLDKFITALTGSVRSGKTWGMHGKQLLHLCTYSVGGRKVIIGVSKGSIYRNVLMDLFDIVGKENYTYNVSTGELVLFPNQKSESVWIVIGAKDEGSVKMIQGMTIGVAYVDEATNIPRSFFDMMITRMSPPGSRVYLTCNPGPQYHWLKVDYFDNPKMRNRIEVIHFTMEDNPNLTATYKATMRAAYAGTFYRRYILGEWVNAEGAIYRDVWPKVEIYTNLPTVDITGKQMPLRPIWLSNSGGYEQRVISVDFGMENPTVFLDWYDTGKRLYLDREFYWDSRKEMQQLTVAEQADKLEEFAGPERRGLKIVLDPSASALELELVNRGFWVVPAENDVLPGIQRVASVLNLGVVSVNASCANFIREMQSYAWDAKKAEQGKEEPVKKDDHSADSARYGLMDMVPEWRLQAMGMAA